MLLVMFGKRKFLGFGECSAELFSIPVNDSSSYAKRICHRSSPGNLTQNISSFEEAKTDISNALSFPHNLASSVYVNLCGNHASQESMKKHPVTLLESLHESSFILPQQPRRCIFCQAGDSSIWINLHMTELHQNPERKLACPLISGPFVGLVPNEGHTKHILQ